MVTSLSLLSDLTAMGTKQTGFHTLQGLN